MESNYDLDWFVDIPGYEGRYMINGYGEVYSFQSAALLCPQLSGQCTKYLSVQLSKDGIGRPHTIHRLICQRFHGDPIGASTYVLHKDGDPLNNHPDNLRWGTQSENISQAYADGTKSQAKGEGSVNSKLTDRKVRIIRGLSKLGYTYRRLAEMFNVGETTVRSAIHRKSWAHVDDRIDNRERISSKTHNQAVV